MLNFILTAAVLVLLVIFLIRPDRITPEQEKPFRGRNYAHRGLHDLSKGIPENSLPAFDAAASAGYGMELDVQLSKDGQVVVFHDDTLDRVTGVHGRVDSFTLAELKQMPLCGTKEVMPLFRELLDTVAGRTPLIVELKSGPRNRELCEKALELLRGYEGVYCVESFDPRVVGWFRNNAPDLVRGQLVDSFGGYSRKNPVSFCMSRCLGNWISRPQFIAWGPRKKNVMVRLTEAFGPMKVFWTAKDPAQAEQLQSEYDAVIFQEYTPKPTY